MFKTTMPTRLTILILRFAKVHIPLAVVEMDSAMISLKLTGDHWLRLSGKPDPDIGFFIGRVRSHYPPPLSWF